MINALYQMGKIYDYTNKSIDLLSIIENPNENKNYNNVIVLEFSAAENVEYKGFRIEEFKEKRLEKYLYKKGAARGGNYTPTLIIDTNDFSKSYNNMLLAIRKIESEVFKNLFTYLQVEENKLFIVSQVEPIFRKKEGYIVTININDKWLNEFNEVVENLIKLNDEKYIRRASFSSYEKKSLANDKMCYVCKTKKTEVYGFVNTFNFYTLDKKGFMSGGFNRKYAWRNYPVCPTCSKVLESGKKYLRQNFDKRAAGFSYYILPKFIFDIDDEKNFKDYKKILEYISKEEISLANDESDCLMSTEDKILKKISSENNNITLDIVFYKADKAAFNILKNIEDVLPSRLYKLFLAKEKVENHKIFEAKLVKSPKESFEVTYYFNFLTLREFFPDSKFEGTYNEVFLTLIHSIFIDKKIDEKFLIHHFIKKVRFLFVNPETKTYELEDSVKRSLLTYKFLKELNLLNNLSKGDVLAMIDKNEKNEKYINFFDEHADVFNSDLKRGTFLVGVLVNNLMSLEEQRNKPFYTRLNSLKMDEKILKRVFVEAINKLNEYDKNYYRELEKLISQYLTLSNFNELSKDELSYYFVTGMNLSQTFKEVKNIKEGE